MELLKMQTWLKKIKCTNSADMVGGHACFQNTCIGMAGSRKYFFMPLDYLL